MCRSTAARRPSSSTAIGELIPGLIERLDAAFLNQLVPDLRREGIDIVSYANTTETERASLDQFYDERVFPVLTPLAVDPGHPFPYISDLALSLAVTVADPETGDRRFARLKVPNVFPRLVPRRHPTGSCRSSS